jgi:hypothetical protein
VVQAELATIPNPATATSVPRALDKEGRTPVNQEDNTATGAAENAAALISTLPPQAARLLAVEILLTSPEALG